MSGCLGGIVTLFIIFIVLVAVFGPGDDEQALTQQQATTEQPITEPAKSSSDQSQGEPEESVLGPESQAAEEQQNSKPKLSEGNAAEQDRASIEEVEQDRQASSLEKRQREGMEVSERANATSQSVLDKCSEDYFVEVYFVQIKARLIDQDGFRPTYEVAVSQIGQDFFVGLGYVARDAYGVMRQLTAFGEIDPVTCEVQIISLDAES